MSSSGSASNGLRVGVVGATGQVGTVMRPTGWTTRAATVEDKKGKVTYRGEKVVHTGKPPWRVANTDVTVTLANAGLKKAMQLDANGYAVREIASKAENGGVVVKLPADCLYAVLQR